MVKLPYSNWSQQAVTKWFVGTRIWSPKMAVQMVSVMEGEFDIYIMDWIVESAYLLDVLVYIVSLSPLLAHYVIKGNINL